jgi:DedD protein
MDTPSKERLVGAIIFVVLIVLVVPEILSGPHHLAGATAPGSSPASAARTYIIDLGNPVKPTAVPAGETKPPPLPAPPALTATSPGTGSTPASAPVAAAAAPPPVADKPATTASAVSGRAPAVVAQLPAATPAPAATTGKEVWGVQLGSFSSAVNAERLARTLRGKGYRAFVSPIGTGTHLLHRVRVGPEPTRDAAEGLLARLKRDGQSAAVVTLP